MCHNLNFYQDVIRLDPKGLVIFKPAVGGSRQVRGVNIYWRPASGGMKKVYIPFEWGWKIPFLLKKDFLH